MSTSRTHVIKRGSGWAVKKQGKSKASKVYPTQDEAIMGARKLTKSSEIVIHNRDGSVNKMDRQK